MVRKSPQPELGHPDCCGHDAAWGAAAVDSPPGASTEQLDNEAGSLSGSLKRWVLWFLTFFGIYASSSVCPFCGTPGCPVGVGGAAVVGGAFAFLWQYGKSAWEKLRGFVVKRFR